MSKKHDGLPGFFKFERDLKDFDTFIVDNELTYENITEYANIGLNIDNTFITSSIYEFKKHIIDKIESSKISDYIDYTGDDTLDAYKLCDYLDPKYNNIMLPNQLQILLNDIYSFSIEPRYQFSNMSSVFSETGRYYNSTIFNLNTKEWDYKHILHCDDVLYNWELNKIYEDNFVKTIITFNFKILNSKNIRVFYNKNDNDYIKFTRCNKLKNILNK